MADTFLHFLDIAFSDSAKKANTTSALCQSDISHYMFYQYSLIPAALLTAVFASTQKRRNKLLYVLRGRPGLVSPMDTLTRESRVSYCCAFGATTFLVHQILQEQRFAIDYQGPVSLKTLIAILSMFVYGLVFFPVFACLALCSALSFALGSLYVWMFFIVDVYKLTECNLSLTARLIAITRALPSLGCLGYLSISLPLRFIHCMLRKQYFTQTVKEIHETLDDVRMSYQGLHVRKLLIKPEEEIEEPGILNTIKRFVSGLVHKLIYDRQADFRYPSRLLSVMFVACCVNYVMTVQIVVMNIKLVDMSIDKMKDKIDLDGWNERPDEPLEVTKRRKSKLVVYYFLDIIRTSVIISISVSLVLSYLTILHMLASFRTNLFAMYRGDFTIIPPPSSRSAVSLCVGSIKYAGFQVAYIVWSYLICFLILFLVSFVLIIIIVLLYNGHTDWLLNKVLQVWPGVVIAMMLMLAQMLLAKYVFLQDGGKHLRLDNRSAYFIFTYFMFFFNIFLGLLSCLMRIIKAIAIGVMFLARLDNSPLPRKFEFLDPGLSAYIGYIHLEAAHTHPVVNVFIRLLSSMAWHRKNSGLQKNGSEIIDVGTQNGHTNDHMNTNGDVQNRRKVNAAARFNWLVVYTLLQNPQIRIYRKGYFQALKIARRDGLKLPISDNPVTEFDLADLQKQKEEEKIAAANARAARKEANKIKGDGSPTSGSTTQKLVKGLASIGRNNSNKSDVCDDSIALTEKDHISEPRKYTKYDKVKDHSGKPNGIMNPAYANDREETEQDVEFTDC